MIGQRRLKSLQESGNLDALEFAGELSLFHIEFYSNGTIRITQDYYGEMKVCLQKMWKKSVRCPLILVKPSICHNL